MLCNGSEVQVAGLAAFHRQIRHFYLHPVLQLLCADGNARERRLQPKSDSESRLNRKVSELQRLVT